MDKLKKKKKKKITTVRGGIRADQHEHSMSRYHTTEVRSPISSQNCSKSLSILSMANTMIKPASGIKG